MTTPLSLYFQREGDNSAPTFVILHGLFGSTPNFTSLAKALSNDFDVIRMDLRNHGRSPHATGMAYPSMAADVAATLAELGVSSAIVLGHSMGGKVAMQLAVDFPSLVNTLIVADIAPKAYPTDSHSTVLAALNSLNLDELSDRRMADKQLQPYLDEPMLRQFLLSNLVRVEQHFQWRINLPAICDEYPNIATAPRLNMAFNKPCCFIRGGSSDYIQPVDYEKIMSLFPAARIETIEGAGHWLHAENPQQFLTVIRGFIEAD